MKLIAFATFDSKAQVFSQPMFMNTRGAFLRAFSDAVNDPKSLFAAHPGDYCAFEIGAYDDAAGMFQVITPINLGLGVQFLNDSAHRLQLPLEEQR